MSQSETIGEKIGEYVSYQRKKRNWTLQDFSEKTDLTPSFILRLEKGEYRSVGFDAIEKLAKGFSMDIVSLLSKCDITTKAKQAMPSLNYYLKERYQFPEEAIGDVRLFIKFIEEKYKKEILNRRKLHKEYWEAKE